MTTAAYGGVFKMNLNNDYCVVTEDQQKIETNAYLKGVENSSQIQILTEEAGWTEANNEDPSNPGKSLCRLRSMSDSPFCASQ
jgi:hypothetical protein